MKIILSIFVGLAAATVAGGLAGLIVNWVSIRRGRMEQESREALYEQEIDAEVAEICAEVEREIRRVGGSNA